MDNDSAIPCRTHDDILTALLAQSLRITLVAQYRVYKNFLNKLITCYRSYIGYKTYLTAAYSTV